MAELPDKPPRNVTETERGGIVKRPPNEVDLVLKVLVLCGGECKKAERQLEAEGRKVNRTTLQQWRDYEFPRRYAELRSTLGRDVSEEMAGRALERALQADEATQAYIAKAVERLNEVEPNHLAKNAYALANAMGTNVDRAQLLRSQPTEIVKLDVNEAISRLERLDVARRVEIESKVLESDAEEVAA